MPTSNGFPWFQSGASLFQLLTANTGLADSGDKRPERAPLAGESLGRSQSFDDWEEPKIGQLACGHWATEMGGGWFLNRFIIICVFIVIMIVLWFGTTYILSAGPETQ